MKSLLQTKTLSDKNHERRKARVEQTAECFTPPSLVQQMLSKLNEYSTKSYQDPTFTYCDPAAGNGNMLLEVLRMKLANKHDATQALKTLYGCDIKEDNIKECRFRLLALVKEQGHAITEQMIKTVINQIVVTSLSHYKNGSLDYDFDFPNKASGKDIAVWMERMKQDSLTLNADEKLDTNEPSPAEDMLNMLGFTQGIC